MQQCSAELNISLQTQRVTEARSRLAALRGTHELPAVVLTSPATVAWATGGVSPPVDRSAATDLVWVVESDAGSALLTTEVERDRVAEEYDPARHGFELVAVPWFDADAFPAAASEIAGTSSTQLASDGHPAFGLDVSALLVEARLALGAAEREELRSLGRLAAEALSEGLRSWVPGSSRDLDVQAAVAAVIESGGADAPVLIVGGDERARRYRHPMASGEVVRELVMAVVVARRAGLHVACTRWAAAGALAAEQRALFAQVHAVDDAVLAASRVGSRYGDVLDELAGAYEAIGHPGAWREHYQGGPIGFAQREFEIAPGQRDSRWWGVGVGEHHAVAWNPSLSGGAKVEDTYLVTNGGPLSDGGPVTNGEPVTNGGRHAGGSLEPVTLDPSWPTEPAAAGSPLAERPAIWRAA